MSNEYSDPELQETPPEKPVLDKLTRNILASNPRVTKFKINWDHPNSTNGVSHISSFQSLGSDLEILFSKVQAKVKAAPSKTMPKWRMTIAKTPTPVLMRTNRQSTRQEIQMHCLPWRIPCWFRLWNKCRLGFPAWTIQTTRLTTAWILNRYFFRFYEENSSAILILFSQTTFSQLLLVAVLEFKIVKCDKIKTQNTKCNLIFGCSLCFDNFFS